MRLPGAKEISLADQGKGPARPFGRSTSQFKFEPVPCADVKETSAAGASTPLGGPRGGRLLGQHLDKAQTCGAEHLALAVNDGDGPREALAEAHRAQSSCSNLILDC